ncbi:DUF4321 domain-containing protein [Thermohalobacter berrensis]|uniref:DUF4321 domain-containing protein n=1 Tax=Thermohalobacter berrensis TaxID=99594 RepID=A0A419T734_9FIRM|nr:DUF4321 domain-containing protein [Thermohalobacter berrensis]RKD33198.1 hypothetical protein BET03_09800 [Thermohalobacter berrensis]
MRTRNRSSLVLIILLIVGIVIGGVIGDLLSDKLPILSKSYPVGLKEPVHLDLKVVDLTFGLLVNINVASIIGLILSILIFRKL